MSTPYYLNAKATKLPEGHDDTLDPAEAPTDAARRQVPPNEWPVVNAAPGPREAPDGPLGPPPVHPAARSVAPFSWPRGNGFVANRAVPETTSPLPDLDPDIAMWPTVTVSIWPFTGTPSEGIWPTGWFGIDNRGVPYVCIAGGEPGAWEALTSGGGNNATALQGTPINAIGPTAGQALVFDGTQWTPANISTPVGAIVMWPSATIPASWLALNGQTITGGATTYPVLAALMPSWVSGLNLVLPDTRNRVPISAGNQYALGTTGGSATVTLTTAMIPQFSVGVSFAGSTGSESAAHNHNFPGTNILTEAPSTVGVVASPTIQTLGIAGLVTAGENVSHTHNMSGVSGSVTFGNPTPTAVPTLPPYFATNFIVKAA